MMMRRVLFYALLLLFCCGTGLAAWHYHNAISGKYSNGNIAAASPPTSDPPNDIRQYLVNRLHYKAQEARTYARRHGYNTHICLLADMRLYSGRNRFFVFDIDRDSILLQGLVAHGRCNERWLEGRRYGNEPGCGCSSLGKYRVGQRYHGRFGLAYKLHGLDSTNNNAFKRNVVLHAHDCVPAAEVYPDPICQSDGCPTLSPVLLAQVSQLIDASQKPILLLLFD